MPFWYFATIPELPPEVSNKSKTVRLVRYMAGEGDRIAAGTPLAIIENYWARMEIDANGEGSIRKTFFDPGTVVNTGDPFAVVHCDGEKVPYGRACTTLKVLRVHRHKPLESASDPSQGK